jgi:hypothetical protein
MKFYKHWIGDYGRDTAHLSVVGHGAYRLMLDHFYSLGKPLPTDKAQLHRLLRATDKVDKKAVDDVAAEYWVNMPNSRAALYELLKCDLDEHRTVLERVVDETWFVAGGLINARAVWEMIDYEKKAGTNRRIAQDREDKRRFERARAAASGGQQ